MISRRLLELVGAQPNGILGRGTRRCCPSRSSANSCRSPISVRVGCTSRPYPWPRGVWDLRRRPDRYLIDYQERGEGGGAGLSSVTATKQVEPYLDALSSALSELGQVSEPALLRLMRLLNSVSGYWALQLLRQSREQVLARIGMLRPPPLPISLTARSSQAIRE